MARYIFFLLLTLSLNSVLAQKVQLDGDGVFPQSLSGQWDFIWNKLVSPSEFDANPGEIVHSNIPGSWKSQGHPDHGCGTYRVKFSLSHKAANYSISFPLINSAAKVWINRNLVEELGVCTNNEKYKAKFSSLLVAVPSDTTAFELVVQVANYSYSLGGIVKGPQIGPTSEFIHESNYRKGMENFFVGSLMAMFIYQIILFFLYQKGKPYLYLGLICLIVSLRATVTHGGSFLLLDLFPDVSMEFWKKLEFFLVYSVVAIFPLYSYYLFPLQAYRKPIPIFVFFSALLCLTVIFTPHRIFYQVLDVCHAFLIGGFIYTFAVIAKAWRHGNKDASTILFGVLASFPFILLEILQNSRVFFFSVSFPYLVEIGVLVFLLFQVYLLANHYALAYKNLETVNASLEVKVAERTAELTQANQIRERLLSVVSHDVKSPLNSLRGVLSIYRQKGFGESEMKTVTGTIEENLSNTSILLDNILLWATSQMKGVKVVYTKIDFNKLVEEHIKIFKTISDNKNISMVTSVNNPVIESDKQILSLVLRNLIANAIKFSFENGIIEIRSFRDDSDYIVMIIDSGKGMPKEVVESLFHSNSVASMEGTRFEKGTGLGLALCYEYLKYISAEISVESVPEKGTTFTIRLPLA